MLTESKQDREVGNPENHTYRFLVLVFGISISSPSSSGMMSSRNSNRSLRAANWRYSSSLKSASLSAYFFDNAASNLDMAFLAAVSRSGRRWKGEWTMVRKRCNTLDQTAMGGNMWNKHTVLRLHIKSLIVRTLSSSAESGRCSRPRT